MTNSNIKWVAIIMVAIATIINSVGAIGRQIQISDLKAENEAMLVLFEQMVKTDESLAGVDDSQGESISLIFDSVLNLQRKVSELGIDYIDLQIQFMHCYLNDFDCTLAGDE